MQRQTNRWLWLGMHGSIIRTRHDMKKRQWGSDHCIFETRLVGSRSMMKCSWMWDELEELMNGDWRTLKAIIPTRRTKYHGPTVRKIAFVLIVLELTLLCGGNGSLMNRATYNIYTRELFCRPVGSRWEVLYNNFLFSDPKVIFSAGISFFGITRTGKVIWASDTFME